MMLFCRKRFQDFFRKNSGFYKGRCVSVFEDAIKNVIFLITNLIVSLKGYCWRILATNFIFNIKFYG